MTTPSLAPGTLLATHWIVGGLLGRTEWTEVYEAEETGGRVAALKLFSATLRSQPPIWEWFEGLCTTLARLPAPAIARVYEAGVEPRLSLGFVAAERMSPPNLGRLVTEKGPLPPSAFSRALTRIAEALDAVHGERVLHGNLKPQNVFVSPSDPDGVRLTDFGGAQLRAGNGIYPALTLGWYAPEIDAGQASPAVDRYALGIVTFFALTGFPWFAALRGHPDGSPVKAAMVAAVGSASERARTFGGALHPAFDAWFGAALALDPAARFTTSSEMARAFERAAAEAERAVGVAPTVPDSPPLSATMPLARPVDPAVAALTFSPAPPHAASVVPPAAAAPALRASFHPSRAPGPVHRRSVVLFAVLGAALVLLTLGALWGFTRTDGEAEAEAAGSASATAALSAAPEPKLPAAPAEPPAAEAAPAPAAPAPPPAPVTSAAPPPASPLAAPAAPPPVAAAEKSAAPKAAATAKTTATAKATATPKATAGVKTGTSTSTSTKTGTKTKKKCGTFLKCK